MGGFIPISTTYVFGTLLTANGNLKQLNIVAAFGMLLNISLNFILIPVYKSVGSASASLFTQFLTALLQVLIARYVFKFRFNYTYLLKLVFFVVAILAAAALGTHLNLDWKTGIALLILFSALFVTSTRLLNLRAFVHMLRSAEPR